MIDIKKLKNSIIEQYKDITRLPEKQRNKIMSLLQTINEAENSDYRYKMLLKAGLTQEVETEKQKLDGLTQNLQQYGDNVVLKGGISNTRYIWAASEGSCAACQALDGTEYDFIEDIPEPPHPNCKCRVVAVDSSKKNNEPCDCWEFFDAIEEVIGDASSLNDEIESEILDIENMDFDEQLLENYNIQSIWNKLINIVKYLGTLSQSIGIFVSNYFALMAEQNGNYDKYYHSKANCEAAQLGLDGEKAAEALSDYKELFDATMKVLTEKAYLQEEFKQAIINHIKDGEDDQQANREGREAGRNDPNGDCGEILKHRLP